MLGKSHSDRRFKAFVCKNKQSLSHFIYFLIFVHHQKQNLGWVKSDKVVDMLKRNTFIDNLSHCCSLSLLTSTECWLHQYSGNKYHKNATSLSFSTWKTIFFNWVELILFLPNFIFLHSFCSIKTYYCI